MFGAEDASEPVKKRPKIIIESKPTNFTVGMQDDPESSVDMTEEPNPIKEFKEPSQLSEFLENPEHFFLSEQFANNCVVEVRCIISLYLISVRHYLSFPPIRMKHYSPTASSTSTSPPSSSCCTAELTRTSSPDEASPLYR